MPRLNEGVLLEDVPDEIRDALQIHLVSSLEETIPIIFPNLAPAPTIAAGPEPDRLPMQ